MEKKQKVKSKKQKVDSRKQTEAKAKESQVEPDIISEKPNDSFIFGGLPERNLKKNLGCG